MTIHQALACLRIMSVADPVERAVLGQRLLGRGWHTLVVEYEQQRVARDNEHQARHRAAPWN